MKRHIILSISIAVLIIVSCKKSFLEVIDKTVLLRQGYVMDLTTTGHYMNGIYNQLSSKYANGLYLPYPELAADNMKPIGQGATLLSTIYEWNQSVNNPGQFDAYTHWYNEYSIIRSCNFVIEKSEEFKNENTSKANNLKGQALAIRAWMHFLLVNIFAQSYSYTNDGSHMGIPYVYTSDIEEPVSRQAVSEVYTAMIQDLTTALQLMPINATSKQFMNYHAATALLARIYLFKGDYTAAKNLCRQVLAAVPLMLNNYPAKLYTTQETEALFQLPPGFSDVDLYYGIFMGYYSMSDINYLATDDIAQLYAEYGTDKRSSWVLQNGPYWVINKFPVSVTGTFPLPEGDHYQTLFRSSEMCLTAAESYAKLNMEDSALYFINEIRTRANIPALTNTVSGIPLLDSIYKERRKEMAFDGIRMFDLLRWKKGVNRMDASNPNAQTLTYPSNKAIAPIPKEDVEIAGLQQNPGY